MKLTTHDIEKLVEAESLIVENLRMHYTIAQLARKTGLNRDKLKKGFKKHFGMTIHEKLVHAKMSLAFKLLTETEKPVKEIAFLTGYTYTSFITRFKKEFKTTPATVRAL